MVFDVEDDAVVVVVLTKVLQGEVVVSFLVDADREGGVNVIGGDLRKEFFAQGIEGADDGDAVVGGRPHGEVGFVAFALAVVFFIAFDVDDVRDVGGHKAFGPLRFVVDVEVLVEDWVLGICFGDPFAFELLEQPRLEELDPKLAFVHFGHVFVVGSTNDGVLVEDQLDLFLTYR